LTKAFNYYLELDNNEKLRNYYLGRLISEFPEDSYVKHIKREYIDRKKTQKGEKVPDFSLFDIDNKKIITEEDILGKYTLIDFWSTYCGPCIAELPTLTEAYKKYFNDEFNKCIEIQRRFGFCYEKGQKFRLYQPKRRICN
jgi:thiol-disulfide isomerase/thioredoxin